MFVRPLALDYQRRRDGRGQGGGGPGSGGSGGAPGATSSLAAAAIERMHGNTHLPQILGAMARYEATGEGALRGAAESSS